MLPRRLFSLLLSATVAGAGAATSPASYTSTPLRVRSEPAPDGRLFERLDPARAGITVHNTFDDPRMWGDRFRELTLGAVETGIAVADFDGDGLLDIFAVSKNGPCALYRQSITFQFYDIAATAGVDVTDAPSSNTGATVVDINQDGAPDIYLCRYDLPNLLFVNNGDGTFTENARAYGLDITDASVHATFADYDRDGDLDCYLVTNILDFAQSPQGRRDYLLRNDGQGHFTAVTAKAGIWGLTQGHTAIWFDANQDGWPDLYVANDFETPDRFYLNRGDGTFVDVVDERLPHVTYFSMGADSGDLNNDGLVDFLITDMRDRNHAEFMTGMEEIGRGLWEMERVSELIPQYMWNAVYLNTGTAHYAEAAHFAGLEATGWTWSARLGDLDNDGLLDAFVTAGMIRNFIDADQVDKQNVAPTLAARANVWKNAPPRRETTLAYRNLGDARFADVSAAWGLDEETVSFGCVLADLDDDGDLDLIYANLDAPPTIIRNHTTTGHAVMIKLAGRAPNRDAIGAELTIETASGRQVRQLYTERGIASSDPALVHFGLGDDTTIARLTVRWPRGQVQVLENLAADRRYTLAEPELAANATPEPAVVHAAPSANALMSEVAADRGLIRENRLRPFDEFTRQRLLPRRLNGQGPALATGDVNGDGHPDVFVSGTAGQSGTLFLANAAGEFTAAPAQPWQDAAEADDVGATFLDLDGDGDLDLFVSAGGVQHDRGDPWLNDRVYRNDGQGTFTRDDTALATPDGESTTAVAAADFDGDGATDLFVGGRVVPGRYPETPYSYLYRNQGGRLVDVTDTVAPGLREVGMVTAATWADVDGDGKPDLLVASEWGPVSYFRNTGGRLEDWTTRSGLADRTGWWRALTVADVNGDGRPDIIAGNVGLNTKYHASTAEPAVLFAGDLGGAGGPRLVEAKYSEGKLVPVRGRSKLSYAFPFISRKFPTYRAYAAASLTDIFGEEALAAARRLDATELASGIYFQQPDGQFRFAPLPAMAQLAPLRALVATDLDGDGHLDLVGAGNDFGPEPNTGRFDGGVGIVLRGDGRGNFTALNAGDSGLLIVGETSAVVELPSGNGKRMVVARTEGGLLLFESR